MHSFNASMRAEFAIQTAVLVDFDQAARSLGLDYLVVGALARDLLIHGVTGIPLRRATNDIDIAIAVPNWAAMNQVADHFPNIGGRPHTFLIEQVEVDIIPFDGVERPDRSIMWANDHEMSVLGMAEALATAVTVDLGAVLVRVASLPSQVVLKLLAWRDRHTTDSRDAIDLRSIVCAYGDEPYSDLIPPEVLDRYDFDVELAGAHHIGAEAGSMLAAQDRPVLRALLDLSSADGDLLVGQLGFDLTRNRQLLEALRSGFN